MKCFTTLIKKLDKIKRKEQWKSSRSEGNPNKITQYPLLRSLRDGAGER